ncbi:MAG: fluoride efflux transporter CrcB [Elainella sp.]
MQNLIRTSLAISLGAVAGALCRYGLGQWFGQWFGQWLGSGFPYATLFVNVTGCFLLGGFSQFAQLRAMPLDPQMRLLVTTGFLGSYTTFSSYELDTAHLLDRSFAAALAYWMGTVLLGLLALRSGMALASATQSNPADR